MKTITIVLLGVVSLLMISAAIALVVSDSKWSEIWTVVFLLTGLFGIAFMCEIVNDNKKR